MPARLILFDIDGTLIDTGGAGRRAMQRACASVFRMDGVAARTADVRFAGMTDPVILESLAQALGIDEAELERQRDELRKSFVEALRDELARPEPRRRVLPGVPVLLEELESRDEAYLGLVTGNIEEGARVKLEALGLSRFFTGGGFASDHPRRPELARRGWRKLCRQFGIEFPRECVVVVGEALGGRVPADANC